MKQKIIISIVTIILIITGIYFYKNSNYKVVDNDSIVTQLPVESDEIDNISESGSIVNNDSDKFIAIFNDAINKKDINLCKTITENIQSNDCIRQVVFMLQKDAKNDTICSELNEDFDKIQCEDSINTRIGNCDKINEELSKEKCEKDNILFKANETLNTAICNKFGNTNLIEKNSCIQDITTKKAIKDKNLDLCKNLEITNQDFCTNKALFEIAFSTNDINYCNTIKEKSYSCKRDFAKKSLEKYYDVKFCEYTGNKNDCEQKTITKKSLINQDIKICDELKDSFNIKKCMDFYKETMKELEVK